MINIRIQLFFSANYIKIAETKSSVSTCIHLEFCLFVCTNYQLDIHQYHLCNVMVKLTFFLTLKWNIMKKLLISFSQELRLFFDITYPGDTFLRENILWIVFSVYGDLSLPGKDSYYWWSILLPGSKHAKRRKHLSNFGTSRTCK